MLAKMLVGSSFGHGGSLLSGFFGGFSGHRGAFHSAFFAKADISPEAFAGTGAVIGFMVDAIRIATYFMAFLAAPSGNPVSTGQWPLILTSIAAAFSGIAIGRRYLHKATMNVVQIITGCFLFGTAVAPGMEII